MLSPGRGAGMWHLNTHCLSCLPPHAFHRPRCQEMLLWGAAREKPHSPRSSSPAKKPQAAGARQGGNIGTLTLVKRPPLCQGPTLAAPPGGWFSGGPPVCPGFRLCSPPPAPTQTMLRPRDQGPPQSPVPPLKKPRLFESRCLREVGVPEIREVGRLMTLTKVLFPQMETFRRRWERALREYPQVQGFSSLAAVRVTRRKFKNELLALSVAQLVGHHPQSERSQVQFLVRARAWVAGSIPERVSSESNQLMFFSHISVSLPLFLSLPLSLKTNT